MANTYQTVNIEGSGSGSGTPPYSQSFIVSSWGLNGSNYEIIVPVGVHDKGASVAVQVFEKVGVDYKEVVIDFTVTALGSVILIIPSIPDLRFEGKVIILGE